MPEILRSLPVSLTTLSPLHIGAGDRLGGLDFVREGRTLMVIDRARLTARLAANQRLADAYVQLCETDRPRLDDFLRTHRIQPKDLAAYSLPVEGQMGAPVFAFVKGANGRPFVPGSSVKGAVRSALLREAVLRDNGLRQAVGNAADAESRKLERRARPGRPERMKDSSDIADQRCFGRDQHHDVLRVLGFADSQAIEFSDFLLADVRVLSVRGTGLETKRTPRGTEMVLPCEVLAPERTVRLRLTQLDHLITDEQASRELGFAPKAEMIRGWMNRCNRVARWAAERELEFYRRYGASGLARWYAETLLPAIHNLRESQCALHFAWGAGFEAMTVTNLLPAEQSRAIRTRLALGRGDPFPKSRKVLFRNREPWLPLGWALLSLGEDGSGAFEQKPGETPQRPTGKRDEPPDVPQGRIQGSLGRAREKFEKPSPTTKASEKAKREQERIARRYRGEE